MDAITVRTTSQTPIYQQLFEQISIQILNGKLESDVLLPSIRVMAKELRVSVITIKKTWELLERHDYIFTVAGKGSYVKKSTKNALKKKMLKTVREALKETVELSKDLNISKDTLLEIVSDLYGQE